MHGGPKEYVKCFLEGDVVAQHDTTQVKLLSRKLSELLRLCTLCFPAMYFTIKVEGNKAISVQFLMKLEEVYGHFYKEMAPYVDADVAGESFASIDDLWQWRMSEDKLAAVCVHSL